MQEANNGPKPGRFEETRIKESVVGKIDEVIDEVKERVANAARSANEKVDAQREPAARTLEKTAQRLEGGANRVSSVVSGAAGKLHETAHYIREHDVREMGDNLQNLVRRYPGPAIAAAAVVGFLVGRAFRTNH
jgi:ElaB/YqjD/DUF883 family membrane-anchored ribosome-binding protein